MQMIPRMLRGWLLAREQRLLFLPTCLVGLWDQLQEEPEEVMRGWAACHRVEGFGEVRGERSERDGTRAGDPERTGCRRVTD